MPEWLRSTFSKALPRLEAEESKRRIRELLAGSGHMEQKVFDNYMDELEMIEMGRMRSKRMSIRPRSFAEFQRMAADIAGFRVEMQ